MSTDFLFKTLESFGFGQKFIRWIKLLYKNAKSKVQCNGALTGEFTLERSVRQGCPLSSLLYSLVAEPLALSIKKDKDIQGMKWDSEKEIKIMQYTDDISIMVKNEKSIEKVMKHLGKYGKASGAQENIDKSEIMYCGTVNKTENRWAFKEAQDEIKVLGIYLGKMKYKREIRHGMKQ